MPDHADTLEFRIKKSAPFSKIYKVIASQKGIAEDSFILQYDGERIHKDATPKMLEFEDEASPKLSL